MSQPNSTDQIEKKLGERLSLPQLTIAPSEFAFKAPQHFINQIETKAPNDPLLAQILPLAAENTLIDDYLTDPVGDLHKSPLPSLIHKYQGRVLLIASPKCDIHCRYCFRRHFPYESHSNQRLWQQALDAIEQDTSIHEVILSGGDPMSLSEKVLLDLSQKLPPSNTSPHYEFIAEPQWFRHKRLHKKHG